MSNISDTTTLLSNISPFCNLLGDCTWFNIRPNVPSPDDGFWCRLSTRLGLVIMGLIAPEMVMLWAVYQWAGAREIVKELQKLDKQPRWSWKEELIQWLSQTIGRLVPGRKDTQPANRWTISHGFFLLMGGFVIDQPPSTPPGRPLLVLPPLPKDRLCDGHAHWTGTFATVDDEATRKAVSTFTEDDIKDKGKNNLLTNVVVYTQTTWFILQCIARAVQGLTITQLEIVTVAFAVINFVTHAFWWHKPSDVGCPIRVPNNEYKCRFEHVESSPSLSIFREALDEFRDDRGDNPCWLLLYPFYFIDIVLERTWHDAERFNGDTHRVPTFYSHTRHNDKSNFIPLSFFVGIIFGAIHCLAWSEHFPTLAEKWLWRSSAIVVTAAPLAIFFGGLVLRDDFGTLSYAVFFIFMFTVVLAYVIARAILLVQPFLLLRSLPPGAYQTVSWTTFIPHI